MTRKYEFTYEDYVSLTKKNYLGIEIPEENKNSINQKHDKTFKKALENPEEMSNFLKNFLDIKVKSENLKLYATEYITDQYETKMSDIVYKNSEEDIYYIVEHQSTVDMNMPYRMLRYCIELMRKVLENRSKKIYPTIVPIVIYTGEKNWTVVENFSEKQQVISKEYEQYKINMKYKLINVNKISKDQLLIQQTHLASIMLIEKSNNKEEMLENIKRIIENTKDVNQLIKLRNYIQIIQRDVLQGEEKEILEIISKKVGNDEMSTLVERLRRENEAIRKEARKEAREETKIELKKEITKLLKKMMTENGESEEKIEIYTKAINELKE